jgi:hypothetical protein
MILGISASLDAGQFAQPRPGLATQIQQGPQEPMSEFQEAIQMRMQIQMTWIVFEIVFVMIHQMGVAELAV